MHMIVSQVEVCGKGVMDADQLIAENGGTNFVEMKLMDEVFWPCFYFRRKCLLVKLVF